MNRVLADGRARGSAPVADFLGRTCRRYLRTLALDGCEVSLSVVTDAQIRALNRDWRGKDRPTDVLSFPAGDQPLAKGQLRPLGDIVISLETARARAEEEGRPLRAELARYLAHGLLHLLGHDHHERREALRMAKEEKRLLGGVGMVAAALGPVDSRRSGHALSVTRKRK